MGGLRSNQVLSYILFLLILTTILQGRQFYLFLLQISKWVYSKGMWLTCVFSTSRNSFKQDSKPGAWTAKTPLFPSKAPSTGIGRCLRVEGKGRPPMDERSHHLQNWCASPALLFLWYPCFRCIKNLPFFQRDFLCVFWGSAWKVSMSKGSILPRN